MVPPITSVIWYSMTVGSVAGHIPLDWSQFQLLTCLYVENICLNFNVWNLSLDMAVLDFGQFLVC